MNEESLRQAVLAMWLSLREVIGDRTMDRANRLIEDALDDGIITDPAAVAVLEEMVTAHIETIN